MEAQNHVFLEESVWPSGIKRLGSAPNAVLNYNMFLTARASTPAPVGISIVVPHHRLQNVKMGHLFGVDF